MSRVGNKLITLPSKVKVTVKGNVVTVEGPLGKLDAIIPDDVTFVIEENEIRVEKPKAKRNNRGYQGLVRAMVANMIVGVTEGYKKELVIQGVGYKCEQKGTSLVFSLGYSHTITMEVPKGVTVKVDKQTNVAVSGIDKQMVGQVAARIRSFKKPEPYKGKGVKYKDETIVRKVGKAGAK